MLNLLCYSKETLSYGPLQKKKNKLLKHWWHIIYMVNMPIPNGRKRATDNNLAKGRWNPPWKTLNPEVLGPASRVGCGEMWDLKGLGSPGLVVLPQAHVYGFPQQILLIPALSNVLGSSQTFFLLSQLHSPPSKVCTICSPRPSSDSWADTSMTPQLLLLDTCKTSKTPMMPVKLLGFSVYSWFSRESWLKQPVVSVHES